jgi:hypothetical protein
MATEGIEIDLNSIPDNPEDALRLLAAIEAGDQAAPTPAAADPAAPVEDKSKAASEPSSTTQQTTEPTEDQAGVATKDGKHVIPYSVLATTRERATRAEQALQEMTTRAAALEQSLRATAQGANTGAAARAADAVTADATERMSDADLEALKDDFPTVYKAMKVSMDRAAALEAQVREQAGFRQEVEAASQHSVEETIQDAIDSNPKLAHIQANDQAAFNLAQQLDDTLKNTPAWANRPMSERFAKVLEMVEQANGPIELPGSKSTQQTPPATAADLKAAAKAAAAAQAKANTAASVPTSLSEFPVGEPPAQTEMQALETMSQFQLAEKLARMTPDQMDAYLARL